jgi:hypothetical protein
MDAALARDLPALNNALTSRKLAPVLPDAKRTVKADSGVTPSLERDDP